MGQAVSIFHSMSIDEFRLLRKEFDDKISSPLHFTQQEIFDHMMSVSDALFNSNDQENKFRSSLQRPQARLLSAIQLAFDEWEMRGFGELKLLVEEAEDLVVSFEETAAACRSGDIDKCIKYILKAQTVRDRVHKYKDVNCNVIAVEGEDEREDGLNPTSPIPESRVKSHHTNQNKDRDKYRCNALHQTLYRIARLCYTEKRWDKALEYYSKCLNMRIELGVPQEVIATTLNDIGIVYNKKAKQQKAFASLGDDLWKKSSIKALSFFGDALDCRLAVYGQRHVLVANVYYGMAATYKEQNNFKDCLRCYEMCAAIRDYCLGKEHTSTILAHNKVADTYFDMGTQYGYKKDLDGAFHAYEKCTALRTEQLGPSALGTQVARHHMGEVKGEIMKKLDEETERRSRRLAADVSSGDSKLEWPSVDVKRGAGVQKKVNKTLTSSPMPGTKEEEEVEEGEREREGKEEGETT